MKELKINGNAIEHVMKRPNRNGVVGFTQNSLKPKTVTMWELFKTLNWWHKIVAIFVGPGYALLPTADDDMRHSEDTSFELHVNVRHQDVILTTSRIGTHHRNPETNENLEAINVCCRYRLMRFHQT
jgi:hypothetical protein